MVAKNTQNYGLIELFFKEKGLVRQHIESFNYFIENEIRQIVEANNIVDSDIDHAFYLKYLSVRIGMPSITENMVESMVYPQECRNRDLTYSANLYVDLEYIRNKQVILKRDHYMGKIPIMVRSKRCHLTTGSSDLIGCEATRRRRIRESQECFLDNGGYFIVNGIERVVMIHEQLSKNRIILESGNKGVYATVTSSSVEHKGRTNLIMKGECFYVQNTVFFEDVSAVIVAKACGIGSDKEIAEIVGEELFDALNLSFEEASSSKIFTEEQALLYLANNIKMRPEEDRVAETRIILAEKVLPNIAVGLSLRNKGIFICLMIRRLALAKRGILKTDDKDFIGNKRFELAGQLLSILFEDTFKKFNFELKKSIDKILSKRTRTSELDALTFFNLQTSIITTSMNRAVSSGNWNLKRFRMERSGVTSVVTRYSYICALGMMTKINSHFEKTRKVSGPRALHTSSWGMLCPADTPEGESCGLVKNLALLAEITTDSDIAVVTQFLVNTGVRPVEHCVGSEFYCSNNHLVYVNGGIFGITSQPQILVCLFREERRRGRIDHFASIFANDAEKSIHIATDNGRICRPLVIVNQQLLKGAGALLFGEQEMADNFVRRRDFAREKRLLEKLQINFDGEELRYRKFSDFVREGKIEYLDVQEESNCRLAFQPADIAPETTHLEIAEFAIFGYIAGLVPYPHHNQSPRNTYQCAMGKQAIGHIATNVKKRFDGTILQLNYTQRPLAASKTLDLIRYNDLPSGFNAMVAVMSYSGYDIEDALILNQGSVDRGMGRVEVYKTTTANLKKYSNGQSEILIAGNLNDGIVSPGTLVAENALLVNKMSPVTNSLTNVRHRGHPAYIDKVMLTKSDNEDLIKIVTRETRLPEVGDKFSSRHGQKGVVGLIVPQADMPFNEAGLSPDIIMNPHGFPSRMTVGKIIELVAGKAGLLLGECADATAFNNNEITEICDALMQNGFNYSGKDVFYSGTTGEPLEASIFYGPIFYQRLKHMVADKIHCRARGPRAILTRQPTEGRAKDGGLRLGEMERDCLIGYGASSLLNERLMYSSDLFEAYTCKDCGVIGYKGCCKMCGSTTPVPVQIPYACKLLFQELMAMNILPKIILD